MDCKICNSPVRSVGTKRGALIDREFELKACVRCGFMCVDQPCTDYEKLYDEAYYQGRGADPMVDYARELAAPEGSIRVHEWSGICDLVLHQLGGLAGKRWLDHGSGSGGLVRHAVSRGASCVGFDTGAYAPRARAAGVPMIETEELARSTGRFDVITLVEVIEHIVDPVAFLAEIAGFLAPGGLLFVTTGNLQPHAARATQWAYVIPEIHVSFFTPRSLALAYERAGLTAVDGRYGPGWTDILRFKILKNLGVRNRSAIHSLLPWPLLARAADARFQVTVMPLARK